MELRSPTLQADSLPSEPPGNLFLVNMVLCIFLRWLKQYLVSDFFLQSNLTLTLLIELWVYVPYLEIEWTLWLLWEIVGGWSNTMWLLRLDREKCLLAILRWLPLEFAHHVVRKLKQKPSHPREEDLKSLTQSLADTSSISQNHLLAMQVRQHRVNSLAAKWWNCKAKMSHPNGVIHKLEIHKKNKWLLLF